VGCATHTTGNILGGKLLTRVSFALGPFLLQGGREKQRCPSLEVKSFPLTLEGLAGAEAVTKEVTTKEILNCYFLRDVIAMNTKREMKSPSKKVCR
jgi:hypothetical protein